MHDIITLLASMTITGLVVGFIFIYSNRHPFFVYNNEGKIISVTDEYKAWQDIAFTMLTCTSIMIVLTYLIWTGRFDD